MAETHTAIFPSDELPSLHSFAIDIPASWTRTMAPESLAGWLIPAEPSVFQANLVIGASRVAAGVTLELASADSAVDAAATYSGFEIDEEAPYSIDGHSAVLRIQSFSLQDPDIRLKQLQVLVFAPLDSNEQTLNELFRMHATAEHAVFDEIVGELAEVVKTFRFVPREAN